MEADIECLEVNSRLTPQKALPAQHQQWEGTAAGPSSGAAGAPQVAAASGWASGGWDASCCSSEDVGELGAAQQPAHQNGPSSTQQQRRVTPLLPGLPLVGGASPQQAPAAEPPAAAALEPAVVAAEQAALQQGQVHTLFDLANLDMSELMAA